MANYNQELTEKEKKALKIVSECKCSLGIKPADFGFIYFDNPQQRYLIDALSNQGNGACYGKKAWRSAGCILGKLQKKGYVHCCWGRYTLTKLGKDLLRRSEVKPYLDNSEYDYGHNVDHSHREDY